MTSTYYTQPLPHTETGDASGIGLDYSRPETYLPDEGLVAAVKVALMLGKPLLLTGEAGSGKTQLAYHLAWDLHRNQGKAADQVPVKVLSHPLRFNTKSDSSARDLFYNYDAIGHFRAAQAEQDSDPKPHIQLNALGLAVCYSHPPQQLKNMGISDLLPEKGLNHKEPVRAVVLIDEIDKAPRDFPNDILNELENLCFSSLPRSCVGVYT
ncbi:MAG: hypothetical protein GY862_34990 [Gammaproteobacteria bacterium]|nr:hypothetical protein [Gammaproteobacteria bacterium]